MRIIGLDIHRVFAEAVALEDATVTHLGRIGMTREHLAAFAATLKKTNHIIVEATGNATALVDVYWHRMWRAWLSPIRCKFI